MNAPSWKKCLLAFVVGMSMVIVAFPFYWMLLTAFTEKSFIFRPPISIIHFNFSLENFRELILGTEFLVYLKNSLIAAGGAIVLNVFAATLAGYGLSRFRFWGKNTFIQATLFTYMFPPMLMAIPMYIIFATLGMRNSYTGLILAHMSISLPLNIWIMWQYFQIVPISLEEAGWVSGSSKFRTLIEICLPSAMPGIISVAVFAFSLSWNDFAFAFILQTDQAMFTLPVGLSTFVERTAIHWGMIMSSSALVSIPTFALVFFMQKYLMRGLGIARS